MHEDLLGRFEGLKNDLEAQETSIKLAILEKIPMPVWACDRDCRIVFWNKSAARLYGYSREEVLGKDFVELFVNKPERAQARKDCEDIVDNDKFIKNMAEDIDKSGNTRKLVTQCFAVYDVAGHAGLQVEISYEVQDMDRLQAELRDMQEAYALEQRRVRDLKEENLRIMRARALACLESVCQNQSTRLSKKEDKLIEARMLSSHSKSASAEIQIEIDEDRKKLLAWEKSMRAEIGAAKIVDDLEALLVKAENRVGLDV